MTSLEAIKDFSNHFVIKNIINIMKVINTDIKIGFTDYYMAIYSDKNDLSRYIFEFRRSLQSRNQHKDFFRVITQDLDYQEKQGTKYPLASRYRFPRLNNVSKTKIKEFIETYFPFLKEGITLPLNVMELKFNTLLTVEHAECLWEEDWIPLKKTGKSLQFEVNFLYATVGNTYEQDNSILLYSENDFINVEDSFSFCFYFKIKFQEKTYSDEIFTLTIMSEDKHIEWRQSLSQEEMTVCPVAFIMRNFDFKTVLNEVNRIFFDENSGWRITRCHSKHEFMLVLASICEIDDLSYWITKEFTDLNNWNEEKPLIHIKSIEYEREDLPEGWWD